MLKPRIVIVILPNPDAREYQVTVEICKSSFKCFLKPFLEEGNRRELKKIGETGLGLLRKLFAIEGVEEIFIEPYKFSVHKEKAFDWKNIQPGVIKAIKKAFRKEAKKVMIEEIEIK